MNPHAEGVAGGSAAAVPDRAFERVATVLCDLDGVVWLDHAPIPGSPEAIARLRASGRRVLFVTNNSSKTLAEQYAALEAIGIAAAGDVVTSAMAAARLVRPGERVLIAGGPGVQEAVAARGAEAVPNTGADVGPIDAVIVGIHRDFDYERLRAASTAIRDGARFIATNPDTTFPTPAGLVPGAGALVAAVAAAAGVEPTTAGKPERPMWETVSETISPGRPVDSATVLMAGDRPDSDGAFAVTIGCSFALVRTGVLPTGAPPPVLPVPVIDVADLSAVAERVVG